jgi:uncharacterized protein (TIGR03086 family)
MSRESERHAQIAAAFSSLVDRTTDWTAPTPVPEWLAHDIVEHLQSWSTGVVHAWTGMDLTTDPEADLPRRWQRHAAAVQSLLDDPTTATHPTTAGPFTGEPLATVLDRIYTPDIYMHSWDLARATGQAVTLDPDYARDLLSGMRQMGSMIRESGQFGSEQITHSTDPVDQLMAFIGRDPQWRA